MIYKREYKEQGIVPLIKSFQAFNVNNLSKVESNHDARDFLFVVQNISFLHMERNTNCKDISSLKDVSNHRTILLMSILSVHPCFLFFP